MLRLGHTGDLHLTDGPRFDDTLACLYAVADDGRAQGVQLWAVPGDLAGTTVPHRQTTRERNALDDWIRTLAETAPVVVIYGNHDAPGDLDRIGKLEGRHAIHLVDRPAVLTVAGARVFCLPYPHKRDWLATTTAADIDGQHREVEGGLRALLDGWATDVAAARVAGQPTIFLGHVSIGGCAVAGGEVLPPGQEIEVSVGDLTALGCDYSGASHIHLCQEMAPGIWYAGSPARSAFGEEDEKGYLIVDVAPGLPPQVHRRLTPARRFVTIEARWADGRWDVAVPEVAGAEVRIRATIAEEDAAAADMAALDALVVAAGAHATQPERRIVPTTRVRHAAITAATTPAAQVEAFFDSLGAGGPETDQRARCLAKLAELEHAAPLAQEDAA